MQKILMLMVSCLALSSNAQAKSQFSVDLKEIFASCTGDWITYQRRLMDARILIAKEAQTLSPAEFDARFLDEDAAILLAQATWPDALREKDEFWTSHKGCADDHAELRRILGSQSSSMSERKEAFGAFRDCIHESFTRGRKMDPFDKMLACYSTRVRSNY